MLDLGSALRVLADQRPIFHSEADLQHALAMVIREQHADAQVRLEVPFASEKRGATDIVVRAGNRVIGIEVKYLTKGLLVEHAGETFRLKDQGATDLRRYDIIKDVQRLEHFNAAHGGPSYVVALTNDSAYWNSTARVGTIDADFRLGEGRQISGTLRWASHASAGSIRNREHDLHLDGTYSVTWHNFSGFEMPNGRFRFLSFKVD